jgi:hypothetical protein
MVDHLIYDEMVHQIKQLRSVGKRKRLEQRAKQQARQERERGKHNQASTHDVTPRRFAGMVGQ